MKILKIVVLAEFEDSKVRQVLVKDEILRKLLSGIALQDGALKVLEEPIEGITLENK
jgi:hypothetical protein